MKHASFPIVAALLAAASSPCAAINAVQNPDMDGGIGGWSASESGGYVIGESYFGSPDAGSMRVQASSDDASATAFQCVDVHRWRTLDIGARLLQVTLAGTGSYAFGVDVYDTAGCHGNLLAGVALEPVGNPVPGSNGSTWIDADLPGVALPVGATSARIYFSVSASLPGMPGVAGFLVDHVQVGPREIIFDDGFGDP